MMGFCIFLTAVYVLLMMTYRTGWRMQKKFTLPPNFPPNTFISVIIPARNEEKNIEACINSILAQQYPGHLYEIIVVDDHSEDNTAAIVNRFANGNVKCISLATALPADKVTHAYKKAALTAGIAQSQGQLIITTDADCIAQPLWLLHIAAIYDQQQPVMIIAPVIYQTEPGLLSIFQLIDFMSMQGITAAAHRLNLGKMSNGANFAFRKSAFEQVNGYEGTEHLASGDDYLLTVKLDKFAPDSTAYLKSPEAIISTAAQHTWRSFLQQRIRWASKSGKYSDHRLTTILLLVYLFNASFLMLLLASISNITWLYIAAAMFVIKVISEYLFLIPVSRFFKKQWALRYFILLQPLHIAYIILAGFLGFVGNYEWKGRKVK
jgi:cellulose synthase/poly-beta-1,6-N-acetylglucosamine synthase-like glycosyltransferase